MEYEMAMRCPFSSDPFDDCYVVEMQSQNIPDAIRYCGGDFEDCDIFKRRFTAWHESQ